VFVRKAHMKTLWMPLAIAIAALIAAFLPAKCGAADEIIAFGLTNRSINFAEISLPTEYEELHVRNLAELGYNGLSVRLGQAQSGLFFSPHTQARLENDNFMAGHAYGRSLNIERRLVSVYCQRTDWATFPVTVDFLPLGTTSKTVQVFVDHILVGEETYTDGAITISSSSSDNLNPRVNPFWRMPDGSIGVLIEFIQSIPPVYLPSGRVAYASHLFIRARSSPLITSAGWISTGEEACRTSPRATNGLACLAGLIGRWAARYSRQRRTSSSSATVRTSSPMGS
jgi:hypothetical protein